MTFFIEGDTPAPNYFFINPNTGVITLLVSVNNLNINLFRVRPSPLAHSWPCDPPQPLTNTTACGPFCLAARASNREFENRNLSQFV